MKFSSFWNPILKLAFFWVYNSHCSFLPFFSKKRHMAKRAHIDIHTHPLLHIHTLINKHSHITLLVILAVPPAGPLWLTVVRGKETREALRPRFLTGGEKRHFQAALLRGWEPCICSTHAHLLPDRAKQDTDTCSYSDEVPSIRCTGTFTFQCISWSIY